MAGVKISTIENGIGLEKIVRSMPNLPAMIGKGMTAFTASKNLSIEEEKIVVQILESTGEVIQVKTEDDIDKSTGLSGSGTAYILYFMEGMINAAKEFGFSDEDAKKIVTQTFDGAIELFRKNAYIVMSRHTYHHNIMIIIYQASYSTYQIRLNFQHVLQEKFHF